MSLFALQVRQHCRVCIWGGHGWHQFLFAKQCFWLHGKFTKLAALADCRRSGNDLQSDLAGYVLVAGVATIKVFE